MSEKCRRGLNHIFSVYPGNIGLPSLPAFTDEGRFTTFNIPFAPFTKKNPIRPSSSIHVIQYKSKVKPLKTFAESPEFLR
ncbi:hypothetical protein CU098_005322, partial [Rhizopus stolonifer]